METTQSFRLAGTMEILEIPCDQDDGQVVIYWETILEAFPETLYVKNGNTLVRKLEDPDPDRNKPDRIKHHPGVILDVVSSTLAPFAGETIESSMLGSKLKGTSDRTNTTGINPVPEPITDEDVINDLQVSTLPSNHHSHVRDVSSVASTLASESQGSSVNMESDPPKSILSLKEVAASSHSKQLGSTSKHSPAASFPFGIHTQVSDSSSLHDRIVQAVQNGQVDRLCEQLMATLQDLMDQMDKNNELASRNNELVSQVKDLMLTNNEMTSRISELTLKITELTSRNMESTALVIKFQESFNVKQDEMKELQIQALNHLALLQSRVQVLMNQTYELHEYPIPRLFVVLPQDSSPWNPKDLISNKFRLYFLCECGDHTRRVTSKIPHHIHLAKHEGYEITRPNEFFQQYGHYVLTILNMLKFGVAVAGVAMPAVSHLIRAEALDRASASLKTLIGNLQTGMDQTMRVIEESTANNGEPDGGDSRQLEDNEALEGADLRKLETFLKNKDKNKVLGNLYRTTTSEGHVKWVCIDHYRENYHEKAAKAFRDTVESMGGSLDESIGRVNVHIRSKIQADHFYQALENAKSVYELEIGLDWDTTYSDFKKLRDCLIKSNVGVLHVNLHRQDIPAGDILNRGKRHDPILEIMRHPSTRSVSIVGAPDDFIKRSSLLSRNDDFSNLRVLEIDLMEFQKDIPGLKSMISKMSHLTKLTMNDSGDKVDHVCGVCGATESSNGSLEVNGDRVTCHVRSRVQAEIVYLMLESSKSVHGLSVDLQVDLNGSSTDDISERTRRHDSIFSTMRHPSTRSVAIMGAPRDFIQRSNLLSTDENFPNLESLHIDISALKQDILSLKEMVSRIPKISILTVTDFGDRNYHVCSNCDAVDSLERSFEVNSGRVKIHIMSRIQAELVLQVLETTTTISGCDIDLRVELKDGSTGDTSDRIRGHDSIFGIMRHPTAHSVVIVEPPADFIEQSSLLSTYEDFPNVKQLNIDISTSKRNIPSLKTMVSRMPNLTGLTVNTTSEGRSNHAHGSSDTEGPSRRSFEVHSGRVTIQIRSGIELDLVYQAFETIQSIYGLDIDLTVDMKEISGDTTDRIRRHDAIFDIMRHPSTHSVTITGAASDFIQASSLVSRTDEFTYLKHLDLDLSAGLERDIPGVRTLLSRMPHVASLSLYDSFHKKSQSHSSSTATSLQRSFEVDDSRVKVHIRSRIQAELVSHVLRCIKSISGLGIDLRVELDDDSTGDTSDRTRGHDAILDIMGHHSTQSVELVKAPLDFIGQLNSLSRNDDFSHLERLNIDLWMFKKDISSIKALISRIPNHCTLRMSDSREENTHILFGSNSMEPLEKSVDGNSNSVKIHLGSSALMELMDRMVERVSSVSSIDIGLHWTVTKDDLEKLRDILTRANVNGVKLHVNMDDPTGDKSTHIQRNDAFFDIMGHPSIDSITTMRTSKDMIRLSSLLSRHDDFHNLKYLGIDLVSSIRRDISGLKHLVSKIPNVSNLTFQRHVTRLLVIALYNEIAEYQTYPITFAGRSLVIPPLTTTRQPLPANQYLTHLLSLIRMDKLILSGKEDGEVAAVDALAKFERSAICLKTLELPQHFEQQGDQFIKNIACIVSRAELHKLTIGLREEEEGGVQILESIQWQHIRYLEIRMRKESIGIRVMKALVEGRNKLNGPVKLDHFDFGFYSDTIMSTAEQTALVRSLVASTSVKDLQLHVQFTPSDMESVLNSADVSRLEKIQLRANGYSSSQVDHVLDCLTDAHKLQDVYFSSYQRTEEQKKRMKARGVIF